MARKVKDKELDSRDARGKLKARGKPYYRLVEPGLHLGYRKIKRRAGTWVARHYVGEQQYEVESIGTADDLSDADGVAILSYWQAVEKARQRMVTRAHAAAGKHGPYTVAQAMSDYLSWLADKGKSAADAKYRSDAFVLPELGEFEVARLTTDQLHDWHVGLSKIPARLRTKPGEKQRHRKLGKDDESKRRRRASANRTLTVLKAALNRAWRNDKVASNAAWHRVEPFEAVDAARVRYLTVAEAKRLINACDPDFRRIIQAALQTGARYGQLAQLVAADFNPDSATVTMRSRKGKGKEKVYNVVLTEEGAAFFRQACVGLAGPDLIFKRDDGDAWNKSHQARPMIDACEHANIKPEIGFHGLRHTWASHAVMNGVPLMVVAKNLGHSDTRMVEKHYGHLAPSYVADAIRAGAPKFGFEPDAKVATLA